ncbi:hypothetical protein HK102_012510, partial [Quaeritorhiza haematococci]
MRIRERASEVDLNTYEGRVGPGGSGHKGPWYTNPVPPLRAGRDGGPDRGPLESGGHWRGGGRGGYHSVGGHYNSGGAGQYGGYSSAAVGGRGRTEYTG